MKKIRQRFFFCPMCGGKLSYRYYQGRPRLTCASCTYIMYENPVVGVAGIILNEKRQILLGRRKRGRYAGLWCIPCGYVEYDEDVYDALKREVKEETNLDVEVKRVFTVQSNFHDPDNQTVGIWFLTRVVSGDPRAGDDLEELAYFDLDHPPVLAFPTDLAVIKCLRKELQSKNSDLQLVKTGGTVRDD